MRTLPLSLLLILSLLTGCAGPDRAGRLLIIGGGLRDENIAIYSRFIELAGPHAVIGVVPTASGVERPGEETVRILTGYARPGQRVVLIPLTKDDAARADDATIAAQIESCRALWFVGGDQSRITAVFRPEPSRTSAAYRATLAVLARGGIIAGTSAGAAMMCDPMITGGSSEDALKHGSAWTTDPQTGQGVGLAPGMGYLNSRPGGPTTMIDQHFTERNRFGRLWVAMRTTGAARGLGVPEDSAVEVDRATGQTRWLGANPVVEMRLSP